MSAARDGAEPHGHLLDHEQRNDQQQLQQHQLHAELRAAGGGDRHAAGFGIGERDDQAGAGNRKVLQPPGTLPVYSLDLRHYFGIPNYAHGLGL
jgi:hypothetical protein